MSFKGVLPAVTTPFGDGFEIDEAGLVENVRHLVDAGVDAIVGTGTMGESGGLTRDERRQVLEAIVGAVDGRIPVVAGIAAQTPAIATGYVTDAEKAGASGFMVLPPLLYNGDFAELVAYFRAVCDASDLPIVAYNNPHAAGYDLSAETLVRLGAELDQVVQVKECSGDVRRIPQIINDSEGALEVLVGGDDWAFEGLCVGASGWISGVADVLPAECVELSRLIASEDLAPARELWGRLLPMARFDMTPKLVQYYKAGLDEIGLTGGPARPPRLPLTDAEAGELRDALALAQAAPAGLA